MTTIQNLDLAIINCAANLAFITDHPRPEYTIEGATYSWMQLFKMYSDQMLVIEEARQRADGAWQIMSVG
jgi:hypothetical protein